MRGERQGRSGAEGLYGVIHAGHWGRLGSCTVRLAVGVSALLLLFALGIADASAAGIAEVAARNAERTSVTLAATIAPEGTETTYHFDWGPTAAYGNRTPDATVSGSEPQSVSVELSGLSVGSRYHYRVVAETGVGPAVTSSDQELETLNGCGLPDQRCFEMVSPKDLGPTGRVRIPFSNTVNLLYQAAPESGKLAYAIENGLPNANRGAEVLYRGLRGGNGWASSEFDAPVLAQTEMSGFSIPGRFLGLSPDLTCGVLRSPQPLTPDPAADVQREVGGENLYVKHDDGTFTLVTNLPPENPLSGGDPNYRLVGLSSNCEKVVFSTQLRYPGQELQGAGSARLYEWDAGALRAISDVPGSAEPKEASGGGGGYAILGAVSTDGSRVFYSARRAIPGNAATTPGEVGAVGIFAIENGTTIVDASASQTTIPDEGATFQAATADGSRVFFTANSGLTAESSSAGTDLYEFNLGDGGLTDLSVKREAGGASVGSVLGFSRDGSVVYFAARGQLVPGVGKTFFANLVGETYSVFRISDGHTTYVGSLTNEDVAHGAGVRSVQGGLDEWHSRVSPDGAYLLFESSVNLTSFDAHGRRQVFLYSAEEPQESLVCVSCRPDGREPLPTGFGGYLLSPGQLNTLYTPASLVVHEGTPEAFFVSRDPLAPGAVEGEAALYEWAHNQVFLVARQPFGSTTTISQQEVNFVGASADGSDLYLFDAAPLNWEDPEGRPVAWDARIGGGFAQGAQPSACRPDAEGACQSQPPTAPQVSSPSTQGFVGPGNLKPKGAAKKPKHKRKRHKNHRHKRQPPKHGGKGAHGHWAKHGKSTGGQSARRPGVGND